MSDFVGRFFVSLMWPFTGAMMMNNAARRIKDFKSTEKPALFWTLLASGILSFLVGMFLAFKFDSHPALGLFVLYLVATGSILAASSLFSSRLEYSERLGQVIWCVGFFDMPLFVLGTFVPWVYLILSRLPPR